MAALQDGVIEGISG